jgi:hypothetical protein
VSLRTSTSSSDDLLALGDAASCMDGKYPGNSRAQKLHIFSFKANPKRKKKIQSLKEFKDQLLWVRSRGEEWSMPYAYNRRLKAARS